MKAAEGAVSGYLREADRLPSLSLWLHPPPTNLPPVFRVEQKFVLRIPI